MKTNQLTQAILLIALSITTSINAQVTIGSGQKPNAGALLDLKQEADGSSQKGLSMPCVELTTLNPTTPAELSASIGNTGGWDLDEHIGLIVYNVKAEVFNPVTCLTTGVPVGMYVWDGSKWQSIGINTRGQFAENINPTTGIGTVTDFEGNVYPTKRWTSTDGTKKSGIWITKNLHSIRKADGSYIDCPAGVRLNPPYHMTASWEAENKAITVRTAIPTGNMPGYINAGTTVTGQSYADFAKYFGLMYRRAQALNACPHGWRLPSAADWSLLAESMDGVWTGSNYRGIGHRMKMSTNTNFRSVDGVTSNWTDGLTTTENGFNALPAGNVGSNGKHSYNFGRVVYYWASTDSRLLMNADMYLSTSAASLDYYSVRCVKD